MNSFYFENRVVVVTGGAQGIGLVTVDAFARAGADVQIWDANKEIGQRVENDFQKQGLKVGFQHVNVADFESVSNAADAMIRKFSRWDVLINNAGITRDATLLKMTPDTWRQVLDVNLSGVFHCTKVAATYMAEKNYGRIVNASSVVGLYGNFGQSNYVATKSGVIGLTKVWARELGRKGITVNAVAPGFIATEMVKTIPEKMLASIREKTPVGRLGTPRDIAMAYLFLASEEASFINGAVLSVDGGFVG